ncbi:hypothetical protein [Pantanalinema sp. GBBB05]|uniref:hypothetical protein n=1 Tax=Pantanalinema sp. GBBB05 TaxID=2604139 RepID=UPI001DBB69D9|nr:hypothetical protein [Pantanalinema sp. GBBB05]
MFPFTPHTTLRLNFGSGGSFLKAICHDRRSFPVNHKSWKTDIILQIELNRRNSAKYHWLAKQR